MVDPPPYRAGQNEPTAELDGTTERHDEWSGAEFADPDEVFLEFPSENIENTAESLTHPPSLPGSSNHDRAVTTRRWDRARYLSRAAMTSLSRTGELVRRLSIDVCGIASRQSAHIVAKRGSILLVSAASFIVGVAAGAAMVWPSRSSLGSPTMVGTATPHLLASELPSGQSTSAEARPSQQMPQALPARPLSSSARLPAYRGSLIVYSRPSGAHVFLNGSGAGTTPLVLKNQRVGSRAVRLELDGYEAWTSAVQVVTNTSTSVRVELKPKREYSNVELGEALRLN